MAGHKYTMKDLVFWTGMMSGIIVVYKLMEARNYGHFVCLIAGAAAGLVLGSLGLKLYETLSAPKRDRMDDDY